MARGRAASRNPIRTDAPRRGLMLVLSSPSGAGKTTLSRMLLAEENEHRRFRSR